MIQCLQRNVSLLAQQVCPTLWKKTPPTKRIMKQELELKVEKYKPKVVDRGRGKLLKAHTWESKSYLVNKCYRSGILLQTWQAHSFLAMESDQPF